VFLLEVQETRAREWGARPWEGKEGKLQVRGDRTGEEAREILITDLSSACEGRVP